MSSSRSPRSRASSAGSVTPRQSRSESRARREEMESKERSSASSLDEDTDTDDDEPKRRKSKLKKKSDYRVAGSKHQVKCEGAGFRVKSGRNKGDIIPAKNPLAVWVGDSDAGTHRLVCINYGTEQEREDAKTNMKHKIGKRIAMVGGKKQKAKITGAKAARDRFNEIAKQNDAESLSSDAYSALEKLFKEGYGVSVSERSPGFRFTEDGVQTAYAKMPGKIQELVDLLKEEAAGKIVKDTEASLKRGRTELGKAFAEKYLVDHPIVKKLQKRHPSATAFFSKGKINLLNHGKKGRGVFMGANAEKEENRLSEEDEDLLNQLRKDLKRQGAIKKKKIAGVFASRERNLEDREEAFAKSGRGKKKSKRAAAKKKEKKVDRADD